MHMIIIMVVITTIMVVVVLVGVMVLLRIKQNLPNRKYLLYQKLYTKVMSTRTTMLMTSKQIMMSTEELTSEITMQNRG